jgi:hypothetical protein
MIVARLILTALQERYASTTSDSAEYHAKMIPSAPTKTHIAIHTSDRMCADLATASKTQIAGAPPVARTADAELFDLCELRLLFLYNIRFRRYGV